MSNTARGHASGPAVQQPGVDIQALEVTEPLLDDATTNLADMPPKPKSAWEDKRELASLASILTGTVLVVATTWILILSGGFSAMGWFTFHPTLQTLSMVGLIYGITPIQPPTPPTAAQRQSRLTTHQNLILRLTMPCLMLGSAAIWWNKYIHAKQHFTTWHACFGVATVLWMTAQAGMGIGMAWYGKEMFGSEAKARMMYKYHRLSGYALIGLVLLTIHLAGAHSHWGLRNAGPILRGVAYWLGPLAIAVGLGLRIQPAKLGLA